LNVNAEAAQFAPWSPTLVRENHKLLPARFELFSHVLNIADVRSPRENVANLSQAMFERRHAMLKHAKKRSSDALLGRPLHR
jgi:hypothetical protein